MNRIKKGCALESHNRMIFDLGDGEVSMEKSPLFDGTDVEDGPIAAMNNRMHFNENLMDLHVLKIISDRQYIRLRKLFRTKEDSEDQKLVVTMVNELHQEHFK